MPFADPSLCLKCRELIEVGVGECPHCGTDLNSHAVQQAWQALVVADQWIAHAPKIGAPEAGLDTPPVHGHSTAVNTARPADRVDASGVVSRSRKLSAGTVLLILGAISLLVAGGIFVGVSWGSMGILGRALTLLAFTAVVGLLAAVMTRRTLRASAESLWAVFLGLLSLDWFAAVSQGLFGLDALTFGYSVGLWGAVIASAGAAIVSLGRRPLQVELSAPSIASGAAAGLGAGFVVAEWVDDFWWAAAATALAATAAFLLHRAAVTWGSRIAGGFAAAFGIIAVAAALFEALEHPSLKALTIDRHGLPLVIVAVAAVVAGRLWERGRSAGALVATLAAAALVAIPTEDAFPERGAYLVAAVLVGAVGVLVAGVGPWRRGVRWALLATGVGLALASLPWLGRYLELVEQGAFGPRVKPLLVTLASDEWSGPGWVALVVAAGLACLLASARRWPELARFTSHAAGAAWTVLAAGILGAVGTRAWPALAVAGATLLVGAGLAVRNGHAPDGWRHLGPALVGAAPIITLSSWPGSPIVWPTAAAALFVLTRLWPDGWLRRGAIFAGTAWALLSIGALMRWLEYGNHWTAVALVAATVVALGVALAFAKAEWTHRSAEAAAGVVGVFGLLLGSVNTQQAEWLPWTVGGAGVALLGIVGKRRRAYIPVGSALLGVAYVLRLADAGVEVVEAYTAPFALALLAAGLWAMRRSPSLSTTRALSAGTTLALLPSLPQALDEPASLRALVLGLVAAAFLAAGISLRWKVPLVGGAGVLLLVVLANFGPLAMAVPRWMLIAALGAIAIAIGATWENRVREGRAAVRYLDAMR